MRDKALAQLDAEAQRTRAATHHAAKCAAVAAAVAAKAMVEAECIASTTAKSIVCEFDPETGFAANDAARASCVARWKGKAAARAGAGHMYVDYDLRRPPHSDEQLQRE